MPVTINGSGSIAMDAWSLSSSASASATSLDRYEEGTWNPYWAAPGGGAAFVGNPSQNLAASRWQRIGNMVYLYSYFGHSNASVSFNSGVSGGLQLAVGGFPFASDGYGTLFCSYFTAFTGYDSAGNGYNIHPYVESGSTFALLTYPSVNGVATIAVSNAATTNARMMIAGFYKIAGA
jgi:hypothetical protein